MTTAATILTVLLGSGGLAGIAVLIKARAERGNVVMTTVEKGVLVLERLNDRLEKDLAEEHAERVAAEARAARYRAALIRAGVDADALDRAARPQ